MEIARWFEIVAESERGLGNSSWVNYYTFKWRQRMAELRRILSLSTRSRNVCACMKRSWTIAFVFFCHAKPSSLLLSTMKPTTQYRVVSYFFFCNCTVTFTIHVRDRIMIGAKKDQRAKEKWTLIMKFNLSYIVQTRDWGCSTRIHTHIAAAAAACRELSRSTSIRNRKWLSMR